MSKRPFALFDFYTIKDVFGVWKRAWIVILLGTLAFTAFGAYWSLSETIRYSAEASFREKNHSHGGISGSSLTALLLSSGGEGGDSSAISTMKSRSIMEELIKLENLQAKISLDIAAKSLWELMYDNLGVEYALFMGKREPLFPDKIKTLNIKDISYDGELIRSFRVKFIDDTSFALKINDNESKSGKLGSPFTHDNITFTLEKADKDPLSGKQFILTVYPLAITANDMSKLVTITLDKDDGTLLRIRFRSDDRYLAVAYVNRLMSLYQDYIDKEHKQMISTQLNYLQKRQNEVYQTLKDKMHHYAQTLSEDFTHLGFTDTERAMEFLASHQHAFKTKQFSIGMEIQRLEAVQHQGKKALDSLIGVIDNPFINKLLLDIRELKQQYDAVHVAFNTATPLLKNYNDSFENNLATLAQLSKAKEEAQNLIAQLEQGSIPTSIPSSLAHPDYMVEAWQTKLQQEPDSEIKDKFLNYLGNLIHHFKVYSKTLEENLSHHQSIAPELQGINLNIANEMFLSYSKETNALESQVLQYDFIIDQLQKPEFELSSLSAILNDPISREISNNASNLALALNDKGNRTDKEIARLQEELKLQRKFLTLHLKQSRELLSIKINLLLDKIQAIRQTTLSIIQQNLAMAENQIQDQIHSRIGNLKQELALITKQQEDLQKEMATLPKKWVSEQLINQHMEMHRQMNREITHLVESKNISSNLEIMQSAPVDVAIPPLLPDSPRFLMFTLLGTFVGFFLMISGTLIFAIAKGVPASDESLRLIGLQVAGSLKDPQTLPRATAMMLLASKPKRQQTVLVTELGRKTSAEKIFQFLRSQGKDPAFIGWNDPLPADNPWVVAYAPLSPSDPEVLIRHGNFDHFIPIIKSESVSQLEPLIEKVQENKESLYTVFVT